MKTLGTTLNLKKRTVQLLDDQSLVNVKGGAVIDVDVIIGSNTCKGALLEARSCCRKSC